MAQQLQELQREDRIIDYHLTFLRGAAGRSCRQALSYSLIEPGIFYQLLIETPAILQ